MGELEDRDREVCEDCDRESPTAYERPDHDGAMLCVVCVSGREREDWEVDGDE